MCYTFNLFSVTDGRSSNDNIYNKSRHRSLASSSNNNNRNNLQSTKKQPSRPINKTISSGNENKNQQIQKTRNFKSVSQRHVYSNLQDAIKRTKTTAHSQQNCSSRSTNQRSQNSRKQHNMNTRTSSSDSKISVETDYQRFCNSTLTSSKGHLSAAQGLDSGGPKPASRSALARIKERPLGSAWSFTSEAESSTLDRAANK